VDSLSKMIDKLYVPLNHTLLADSQIYYSKGSEPAKSKTRSTGTGIRLNVGNEHEVWTASSAILDLSHG
jgi:hypothetical protein